MNIIDDLLNSIVNPDTEDDIRIDCEDMEKILGHQGTAYIGKGSYIGSNAALSALKIAIESVISEKILIPKAKGVLVRFRIHPSIRLFNLSDAMERLLHHLVSDDADVIFGTHIDEFLKRDQVITTIILTGIGKTSYPYKAINDADYKN